MRLLGERNLEVAQPAGEEVFRQLRTMIIAGEIKHGEHLVERRLAEMLNVSRTPIREALRKLEAEGLVNREAYRGLVVASLTAEDLIEILRIREVLEGLATSLAAARHSHLQLRKLRNLVTKMETASHDKDPETFTRLHLQFHEAVQAAAASPRLYNLISSAREHLEGFTRIGYRRSGRSAQAHEEHLRIVERIAARDEAGAEEVARLHVRHSEDALLAVLRSELQQKPTPGGNRPKKATHRQTR